MLSDDPSNIKRGGVAIYYKDHLPVFKSNDIFFLIESIVLEIRLANNKCYLTGLYKSLSQKKDQFDEFCSSFNMFMANINDEKALASIITGDFNADITNSQGSKVDTLTYTWLSPTSNFARSYDQYKFLLH